MARTARERLKAIDSRILALRMDLEGAFGLPGVTDPERRAAIERELARARAAAAVVTKELEVEHMRDKAKAIRDRMRKDLAAVAAEYAEVRPEDDERFPIEFQTKRGAMRGDLRREYKRIESAAQAELQAWAAEAAQTAEALYHSDPIGDPAEESRRVSEGMEAARLAERFIGQPTMARNQLLPEARRFIALGVLPKARVYLDAARRAGVEDARLDHALNAALDESVPHRKQAREQLAAIADEQDLLANDVYAARLAHDIGTNAERVQASTMTKLIEWRRREGLVPVAGSGGEGSPAD